MAKHHGKNGRVLIGAATVAEVTDFTLSLSEEVAEAWSLGDVFKTKIGVVGEGEGTIECYFDPSDATGQEILNRGDEATLLLYPEDGSDTGETEYSCPIVVTSEVISLSKSDYTTRSFAFALTAAPTIGVA